MAALAHDKIGEMGESGFRLCGAAACLYPLSFCGPSDSGLRGTVIHEPAVDIAQHLAIETMVARIRLEGDTQAPGTQGGNVAAGAGQGMAGIPGAVDDENR